MTDEIIWLVAIGFGLWLTVHCPRAAVREFRTGVARGLDGTMSRERQYARATQPVGFWITIGGTFLAGMMGLFLTSFGIMTLFWGTQ